MESRLSWSGSRTWESWGTSCMCLGASVVKFWLPLRGRRGESSTAQAWRQWRIWQWRRVTNIGQHIQTCDSALEAGMAWVCRLGKDFIGKAAIVEARKKGKLQKHLIQLSVGAETAVKGGEPIMLGGKEVGYVRRTGDGFSVNKVLAFGYAEGFTPTADPSKEEWGLQVSGEYVPASRHFGAIFDPEGAKIKGGGTAKKATAI